MFIGLSIYS